MRYFHGLGCGIRGLGLRHDKSMTERRSGQDRRKDRKRMTPVAIGYDRFWKRVAQIAVVCWTVIATTGFISLYIQKGQSDKALDRANIAVANGDIALSHATRALHEATKASGQAFQAAATAVSAQQLARSIQRARIAVCIDQNKRHRDTLRRLQYVIDHGPHYPSINAKVRKASEQSTIFLINGILPQRKCR